MIQGKISSPSVGGAGVEFFLKGKGGGVGIQPTPLLGFKNPLPFPPSDPPPSVPAQI